MKALAETEKSQVSRRAYRQLEFRLGVNVAL
jgi:hypothetical protein